MFQVVCEWKREYNYKPPFLNNACAQDTINVLWQKKCTADLRDVYSHLEHLDLSLTDRKAVLAVGT
jgi:hypothetical protein